MHHHILDFISNVHIGNSEQDHMETLAACLVHGFANVRSDDAITLIRTRTDTKYPYGVRWATTVEEHTFSFVNSEQSITAWMLLNHFQDAHVKFEKAYQKAKEKSEA